MDIKKIVFKPVALPCGIKGTTRLYTTNLFSGACPHSCKYCYAQGFKSYSDGDLQPISIESIKARKRWPQRIFLSSASDPFHPKVIDLAEELLRSVLPAGTFVVISTKALATPSIINILSKYSDQVSYTVSLSNLNERRNCLLEPRAPKASERLYGKWENNEITLYGIAQIAQAGIHITLKADTLFPDIDDNEKDIQSLLQKAKKCGVQAVTFSYAFYRNKFKKKLSTIPQLHNAIAAMTEYQPIASGKGFSLPLSQKRKRLVNMAKIASDIGYQAISTCHCKNQIEHIPKGIPLRLDCHFHDKWF